MRPFTLDRFSKAAGRTSEAADVIFLYSFILLPTPFIFGRWIAGFIFFIDGKAKGGRGVAFHPADGVEEKGNRRTPFDSIDFFQLLIMVGMYLIR